MFYIFLAFFWALACPKHDHNHTSNNPPIHATTNEGGDDSGGEGGGGEEGGGGDTGGETGHIPTKPPTP
ncbi:hypothetical protein [Sediminibacterium ginsengisoli]|uniref:Uncharacterized protein n=1 Tax=Sediminibacterium ginsengisoli TaxID=413434 RepID=A0A1T4LB68_9BACT|nr:hypothetical protein [Sediminibacterium ginsengisoli]SJZ51985.1 hypothetical protein SAMN04488132_102411 [Sediminibacterium ginsengisoli]